MKYNIVCVTAIRHNEVLYESNKCGHAMHNNTIIYSYAYTEAVRYVITRLTHTGSSWKIAAKTSNSSLASSLACTCISFIFAVKNFCSLFLLRYVVKSMK